MPCRSRGGLATIGVLVGAMLIAAPATLPARQGPSVPVIHDVSPAVPRTSTRPQLLTVNGSALRKHLTLSVVKPDGNVATYSGRDLLNRRDETFVVPLVIKDAGVYTFRVSNADGSVSAPFVVKVNDSAAEPEAPRIDRVMPNERVSGASIQEVRIDGVRFDPALKVTVTDPGGQEVSDISVDRLSPKSFRLKMRFDQSGPYLLTVERLSGATSNAMAINVR
ncbi:MAG TPA: hypothetical protein VFO19_13545 [Vicinamibacterales bacterium]|nr:hypothetical protein [Vicinamibacterales bacterium]